MLGLVREKILAPGAAETDYASPITATLEHLAGLTDRQRHTLVVPARVVFSGRACSRVSDSSSPDRRAEELKFIVNPGATIRSPYRSNSETIQCRAIITDVHSEKKDRDR